MRGPTLAQLRAVRAVMEPFPPAGQGESVPADEFVAALMWLSGPVPDLPFSRASALLDAVIAAFDAVTGKEER